MPKLKIRCKLCCEIGPATDTHVIPEAFYRLSKGTHDHLKVISSVPGERPSRSRIGFYDQNLLCRRCEARFQAFDDYGIHVLLRSKREPYEDGSWGGVRANLIRCVDRNRFNEFLSFLLWRILASDLPAFKQAINPQFEARLRSALLAGLTGTWPRVQALATTLCHTLPLPEELNLVLNGTVYVADWQGVPTLNIGLGDLLLIVNLSGSSLPSPASRIAFPECLDRVGGLLVTGSEEYSNRHILSVQKITQRQAADVKIMDMARRVKRHSPYPCLSKKKRKP